VQFNDDTTLDDRLAIINATASTTVTLSRKDHSQHGTFIHSYTTALTGSTTNGTNGANDNGNGTGDNGNKGKGNSGKRRNCGDLGRNHGNRHSIKPNSGSTGR